MTVLGLPAISVDEGSDASTSPLRTWWRRTRSPRMAAMIGILWVLALADLGFTLWAHLWTPFVEGNPLAAKLLSSGMYTSVVLLKVVTTLISTLIFWRLRKFARGEFALAGVLVGMLYLTYLWTNYTQQAIRERAWVEVALKTAPALQVH
jgi:hypothetical protein